MKDLEAAVERAADLPTERCERALDAFRAWERNLEEGLDPGHYANKLLAQIVVHEATGG